MNALRFLLLSGLLAAPALYAQETGIPTPTLMEDSATEDASGKLLDVSRMLNLLDTEFTDLGDMSWSPELGRTQAEVRQIQLLRRGNVLLAQREYARAVQVLSKLVEEAPDMEVARLALSTAYINSSRYTEADKLLTELADAYPENYTLLNNLAWLYATSSDPNFRNSRKAVVLARDALLKAPNNYHVWSTLSEAYYLGGEYEKALNAANEAFRLSRLLKAEPRLELEYAEQVQKCAKASRAMAILD